ncbi:MAG TPA: MFS transporter, partial [Chroococcales cyanobacterium]
MRKTPSSIFSSSGKSANNRKPKLAVDTQASEFSNDASFDRKAVGILSLGHLFNDLAQGTIPAMLPYLISAHDLSYESAARLVLSSTLCSSVLQPLFGWLSDTGRLKIALAPLGLALCGVTTGLLGLLTDYQTLLICTAIGGIGNAAFHPDGGR